MSETRDQYPDDGTAIPQSLSHAPPDVIRRMLDAAMAGDRDKLDALLKDHPMLREEFEGLFEAYPSVQRALRDEWESPADEPALASGLLESAGADASMSEDQQIGELTRLTRDWSAQEVLEFYQSFSQSIVLLIAGQLDRTLPPQQALLDAAYLCSREMVARIQEAARDGIHARQVLLDVLAERWQAPELHDELSLAQLDTMMKRNRFLARPLRILEAFWKSVA